MSGMPPKVDLSTLQQHGVDAESLMSSIVAVVEAHPDPRLKPSLVAYLADSLGFSEYGRDATDTIAPQTHEHSTVAMSHFDRASVGSNVIVTVADTNTDEIYVLMAQKYKDPKRPELGLQDKLITVGGYMEAHAAEGAPNPSKPYDKNLAECAIRELKEETGIELPENYRPESLGTRSDYRMTSDPRQHGVTEDFHVNMYGTADNLPEVTAQDDIAALHWVKASTIFKDDTIPPQEHNSDISRFTGVVIDPQTGEDKVMAIRDDHGEPLVKAVIEAQKTLEFLHRDSEGHQIYTPNEPETYGNKNWPNTTKKDFVSKLQDDFHAELEDHYEAQVENPVAPELANLTDRVHNGTVSTRDFALQSLT